MSAVDELPLLDEHTLVVEAEVARTWDALLETFEHAHAQRLRAVGARLLGCVPASRNALPLRRLGARLPGFEVIEAVPSARLTLAGRHRFARYALRFDLAAEPGGATSLKASTLAEFPGWLGTAYREMLLRTGVHVLAVEGTLRRAKRWAEASEPVPAETGSRRDVARFWGSIPAERARAFPCDRYLTAPRDVYYRAIDIDAPATLVFRWLCQLRAAPYSYDWIDNFGRQSPRELTPGLEQLELGQRFMTIFDLVEFEPGRQITLDVRHWRALFGPCAVSYLIEERGRERARLLVKLRVGRQGAGSGRLRAAQRQLMPWLELAMMRKQLLTLRELAERSAPRPEATALVALAR